MIDLTNPETRITAATMRYLRKKNVTLWQSWEITQEKRKREAANWLAFTFEEVAEEATLRELFSVLYDSRVKRWRRSWQNSSMRKKLLGALRRSEKRAQRLRLMLLLIVMSLSVRLATQQQATSARSKMTSGSTSDFLEWISRLGDTLGVS